MPWLSIAVIVYGICVAAGGVMGKVEAGSNVSAITGGISGLLIVLFGVIARNNPKVGYTGALVLALALTALFIYRYATTHKPMPAFGVIGLSVLMIILLIVGHFTKAGAGATAP